MKLFFALSAVIFAVTAMPAEIGEIDLSKEGDIFYDKANFTADIRMAGQAGFATVGGGTRGGTGGAVWTVWDPWALRDAVRSTDRRIVYVRGRVDLTQLFTASPGVGLPVGMYTSIIGTDRNAMIFGGGLRISNTRQVIVSNIRFHNALSYAPGEQPNGSGGIISMVPGPFSSIDAIEVSNSHHVWIDHCEFADDPWNANNTPENMRRHDGLIDIVRGSDLVSVSNSVFRNHNHVALVGNGDNVTTDRGRLRVTWYLNWFQGVTQRCPRVRFGQVHVLNNLYTDIRSYGIGIGVEAQIYAERNAFINTRRAWGWAAGVPNPMGFLVNFNNLLHNSNHDAGITGGGVNFIPDRVYGYTAMAAASVEGHVRRYAGTR